MQDAAVGCGHRGQGVQGPRGVISGEFAREWPGDKMQGDAVACDGVDEGGQRGFSGGGGGFRQTPESLPARAG